AIVNYEKAISLNPLLFESLYNLSVCYINTGEPEKAIPLLGKALQIRSNDPSALSALEFAIKKKGSS
ncbi:MAG: tetratricopeptide repeat protein, partial [Deltaproteobacteria bacterium]